MIESTEILDSEDLPEAVPITDGIVGYPWRVENKYYTAEVQLCSTPAKTIGNADFADRLEAIIIVFDDTVSRWRANLHASVAFSCSVTLEDV